MRTYTWGLDIARSLTDAGGVGALLQIHDYAGASADYLPSYDGNGNLAALFDAGSGACVAAYEYSPYGEFLRSEGTYARENPFRFSTKSTDDESGLVYYGRRYYSPSQGRFLGRDPKLEKGGLNLYGFVTNNPINNWDYLGMVGGRAGSGLTETLIGSVDNGNGTITETWEYCTQSGSCYTEDIVVMAPVKVNDKKDDPDPPLTIPGITPVTDTGGGSFHITIGGAPAETDEQRKKRQECEKMMTNL